MGRRVGDRKAEEEPIAELWATTTTPRGPARLPNASSLADAQQAGDLRDTSWHGEPRRSRPQGGGQRGAHGEPGNGGRPRSERLAPGGVGGDLHLRRGRTPPVGLADL